MTTIPTSAAELVALLRQNDNEIRVPDPPAPDRMAWRRVIFAVLNSDAVPTGLRLRHTGRDHGDLIMRLVPDVPENQPRKEHPEPLPVPERLTKSHPLLAATRAAIGARPRGSVDTRPHRRRAALAS